MWIFLSLRIIYRYVFFMFGKSVLVFRPTVVRGETGGDPSPYGVGVLKGEIFARFLGRDCTRVYRYFTVLYSYTRTHISSIMIDDGSICMGDWKIIDYFWGDCRYYSPVLVVLFQFFILTLPRTGWVY